MSDLWYKKAIIYSLDVESYYDSNNDGIGDFIGLCEKLDYLQSLGINCLWLLPFFTSPNRDNGYDIKDYYNIDPRLGNLGDFVEFINQARERGIRVIIDLVVNHTSIEHPWFQEARTSPDSRYRNYFVWSQEKPKNAPAPAFPGEEENTWTFDEKAKAYYLHRFYKEQPDLNISNPEVKEEIRKIMRFWLQLGVSGFRIDAATILIELDAPSKHEKSDQYDILNQLREFASGYGDVVLLAEANDIPDDLSKYFGKGDRMNMLFNFMLNQHMFLALAREDSSEILKGLDILPETPSTGKWLNFIRHHDELTLDQLTEKEREEIFGRFAPEENMRIYNRGIRRRLPPILNNNRKHIEMVYSLVFSLPGIPMLRYGDEIAMGDDLSLKGRDSVRTVMQWNVQPNGGFSKANEDLLVKPTIKTGDYQYKNVNVNIQENNKDSFLNWIKKLVHLRKKTEELRTGRLEMLSLDNKHVVGCKYTDTKYGLVVYHNLSAKESPFTCNFPAREIEIQLSDSDYQVNHNSGKLTLAPFGYLWIKIELK